MALETLSDPPKNKDCDELSLWMPPPFFRKIATCSSHMDRLTLFRNCEDTRDSRAANVAHSTPIDLMEKSTSKSDADGPVSTLLVLTNLSTTIPSQNRTYGGYQMPLVGLPEKHLAILARILIFVLDCTSGSPY